MWTRFVGSVTYKCPIFLHFRDLTEVEHGLENICEGDHSGCAKPPVDIDLKAVC